MSDEPKTIYTSKTPHSLGGAGSQLEEIAEQLKGKVLLYYPVYVNTFALAYLLEKHKIKIDTDFFDWTETFPSQLTKVLEDKKRDIILCFSSADKDSSFRKEVQEFITRKNLPYSISSIPSAYSAVDGGMKYDIDYSNFSLKYLFFTPRPNTKELFKLASFDKIFEPSTTHKPYLSKLSSALLARGYKNISIITDITDESKNFLRKSLHEEFGFKFQLTPASADFKANNTLRVETKGGQQAYEEIMRQEIPLDENFHSNKLTFEIPARLRYTSKTKLIIIYKNEIELNYSRALRIALETLIGDIFDKAKQDDLFPKDGDIHEKFAEKNLEYILKKISNPNGSLSSEKLRDAMDSDTFLASLKHYLIYDDIVNGIEKCFNYKDQVKSKAKEAFLHLIAEDPKYLQIDSVDDYIRCLRDHHISAADDKEIKKDIAVKKDQDINFSIFCRQLLKKVDDEFKKMMINGLFLIHLLIKNPNGLEIQNVGDEEFCKVLKQKNNAFNDLLESSVAAEFSKEDFFRFYTNIRIIAEDLNYLISEEWVLCNPKLIFKIMPNFDITAFEYLYSITIARELN